MKQYFLIVSAVFIVLAGGLSNQAKAAELIDLERNYIFYEEIMYLSGAGVISGYPDGTFRPDEKVTRAQAAMMIGRALNLDGTKRSQTFSDVRAAHQASGYIASAAEAGIIKGYPDGTFRPDDTVTRGQMAIFLSRAFQLTKEAVVPFTDVSPAMASFPYIKRLIAANLTQGYSDHTFRPEQKLTRAQFSAFLARGLNEEFKKNSSVQLSYLRDTSKVYYFRTDEQGSGYCQFARSDGDWNLWHVYIGNQYSTAFADREDVQGCYIGYPGSEYDLELAYPIKTGYKWDGYGDYTDYYQLTASGLTIETPAGIFHDAAEVTTVEGWVSYYAPGAGLIKQIYNGTVKFEIVQIK